MIYSLSQMFEQFFFLFLFNILRSTRSSRILTYLIPVQMYFVNGFPLY